MAVLCWVVAVCLQLLVAKGSNHSMFWARYMPQNDKGLATQHILHNDGCKWRSSWPPRLFCPLIYKCSILELLQLYYRCNGGANTIPEWAQTCIISAAKPISKICICLLCANSYCISVANIGLWFEFMASLLLVQDGQNNEWFTLQFLLVLLYPGRPPSCSSVAIYYRSGWPHTCSAALPCIPWGWAGRPQSWPLRHG